MPRVKNNCISPIAALKSNRKRGITEPQPIQRLLAGLDGSYDGKLIAALMESLHEGIVACDFEGNLTHFNHAAVSIHGAPDQKLPIERWAEYLNLYETDGLTPMKTEDTPLYRALKGEKVDDIELVIVPPRGEPRRLLVTGRSILSKDNQIVGAVVAMADITARHEVELDRSRLAAIVEHSNDAIFATALDGQIATWNSAAERLYGYATSEITGCYISILAASGAEGYFQDVRSRIETGQRIESIDTVHVRKNGEAFHVSITFSPIRNAIGELIGLSGVFRDITQKKMAEFAIADYDERLRRINDAAFEGIAVSQDGHLIDVNEAFAAMYRYNKPEEMLGQRIAQLGDDGFCELVSKNGTEYTDNPSEAQLIRHDGSTFTAEVRCRSIQLAGRPAQITAVHDITARKEMEDELRRREASLRAVLESAPVILFTTDSNGIVMLAEETHLAAFGITSDEFFGRSILEFSNGNEEAEELMRQSFAGESVGFDMVIKGTLFHTKMRPLIGPDGKSASIIGVAVDITQRTRSEERFRILFQYSSNAHIIFDHSGIIDCNESALQMLNCESKAALLGRHPAGLSPEFQPDGRLSSEKSIEMDRIARDTGFHRFEWVHRKFTGEEFLVEVSITPVTLNEKPALLVVWHDLTDQKKVEQQFKDYNLVLEMQKFELEKANEELSRLATTDGLTGLKNHRAFQERLSQEVDISCRYGTPLSVIMLDVDHFKTFNDEFGHPEGDQVLMRVARILTADIRESDTAARYGGEEFVVLLPHSDLIAATHLAERMRKLIQSARWELRPVTASFGVTSFIHGVETASDLVSRADEALYESKTSGRNCVTARQQPTSLTTTK